MSGPKTIICLLCCEEVDFAHMENKPYFEHLDSKHQISYYRHLTLMLNIMDDNCRDYFSNLTHVNKPQTLVCLLCRKENDFSDEEGDEYFSHLKNEHKIVSNLQLVRSINLMDSDGLRGIISKFEQSFEVDDEVKNEENPPIDYVETNLIGKNTGNVFAENDYANLMKKSMYDEKMLDVDGSTLADSMKTPQNDEQEEMFGELEKELLNGSGAINYHKSKSEDVENTKSQSESLLIASNHVNVSFPIDSMNLVEDFSSVPFDSNASVNGFMNFHSNGEFDSVIKPEASNKISCTARGSPKRKRSKKVVEIEHSDFSEAVKKEIAKGNLSTNMDVPYEKTLQKMKELTGMFMNGTSCAVCDRGFNTKSHLHEHIESLHSDSPVYFCHSCELPITSSARLRQHKRSRKCKG